MLGFEIRWSINVIGLRRDDQRVLTILPLFGYSQSLKIRVSIYLNYANVSIYIIWGSKIAKRSVGSCLQPEAICGDRIVPGFFVFFYRKKTWRKTLPNPTEHFAISELQKSRITFLNFVTLVGFLCVTQKINKKIGRVKRRACDIFPLNSKVNAGLTVKGADPGLFFFLLIRNLKFYCSSYQIQLNFNFTTKLELETTNESQPGSVWCLECISCQLWNLEKKIGRVPPKGNKNRLMDRNNITSLGRWFPFDLLNSLLSIYCPSCF